MLDNVTSLHAPDRAVQVTLTDRELDDLVNRGPSHQLDDLIDRIVAAVGIDRIWQAIERATAPTVAAE